MAQAGPGLEPNFAPRASEIPAFLITPDNRKINFQLNELPSIVKEQPHFGKQEVTVLISGLPTKYESVKRAVREFVQSYMQRYNANGPQYKFSSEQQYRQKSPSSTEDNYSSSSSSKSASQQTPSGSLIVINFGDTISEFSQYATVNTEEVGIEIGNILAEVMDKNNVLQDNLHLIGSNIGANIAGAAGRQFIRATGHQLRRITGLDPVKTFAKNPESLSGLARGDAEFVDIIHTTANSMGTSSRSGNVDFFPNGPNEAVPGTDNIIQSSMRAVRYFAESVVPGNERNFPAVGAQSLQDYKTNNGYGSRIYMGIKTPFNAEGDYMLQVNTKAPFGRSTPAKKQSNYHNLHTPWKMTSAY